MSQRYLGGVITANPTTPTMTTESGVWTLEQQFQYSSVWSPKIVGNSVRLRSSASAYFGRTPGSASNRRTMTLSMWQKRGEFSSSSEPAIMWAGTNSSNYTLFRWGNGVGNSDSKFFLNFNMFTGGSTNLNLVTTPLYRDPSAWYHIVLSIDTTQATAANRVRLYINGVEVTSFSSASYPAQNLDLLFNSTNSHEIGRFNFGSYLDGYMGEVNFIDGQQLTPSSFGAFDSTGVWQPLLYTGTYGTNGFYLTFSDNSAATAAALGKDTSGNGNNWTPNNVSLTAGTTYDWMLDSPTNWTNGTGNGVANYAVVNPLSKGTSQTSVIDGNLYAIPISGASNWGTVFSSIAIPTSGKWYMEATAQVYAGAGNNSSFGVVDSTAFIPTNTAILYQFTTGEGFDGILAHLFNDYVAPISDGVQGTNVTGLTGTSINLMLALDVDNGKVYAGYNGTWLNSGNPAGGTGEVATRVFSANDVVAGNTSWNGTNDQSQYFNFGQRPFSYTPPTGFKALNTLNLPDPTIMNGAQYMAATTYTGNGGTQTVANSGGFAPDFVWIKNRGTATDHGLFDTVRGATKRLASNLANAETTEVNSLTAFTSTGFTVGATQDFNQNAIGLVGWQWKEGVPQGFDIVAYTGDGTSPRNISHNLGVAPAMVIVKSRGAVASWMVKHKNLSANNNLFLESTSAQSTPSNGYIQDLSSSSTFGVVNGGGGVANVNTNGTTYVAYCFAQVAGYSAFGSYTGNGSTDGPFVYLGFRPRFVMIKRTDTAEAWTIVDTSRTTSNTNSVQYLIPNSSGAEFTDTNSDYDILSNGLKFRDSGSLSNGSGGTYIYAAFAENPFKIARAR